MLSQKKDPIIAIATAPGRGAVGIVRLSANSLTSFIDAFFGQALKPRYATLLPFLDAHGKAIDEGLAIYFPAPHSYTGEDVLELQAHGGPVVLQLLIQRCLEVSQQESASGEKTLPDLRLAQPGEFTERAFYNDKIDLAKAEGIADLINATTEMAARSASRSLDGAFSRQINQLLEQMINLRMLVEATLDFPEEEIDFLERDHADEQALALQKQLNQLLLSSKQGALLRDGLSIVIAGQPNAGKSSLLNALAGSDVAIVTPIAGTTRDKVSQTIQLEGIPLHIIDTAGLRRASDEVEKIGIDRAWEEIKRADAIIFLHDLTRLEDSEYQKHETELHEKIMSEVSSKIPVLEVYNKVDIAEKNSIEGFEENEEVIYLSALKEHGIDALKRKLLTIAGWQAMPEDVFMARERHLQALIKTKEHVENASHFLNSEYKQLELIAEELRLAQQSLSEITGEFSTEDMLGVIFSQFCIGK